MRITMLHPISLQRLCRTKRLYIYVASVMVLLAWSAWYSRRHYDDPTTIDVNDFEQNFKEDHKRWVIENKGAGCVMPELDPFDEEAMKYERILNTGRCKPKDWVECFMDECFVNNEILQEFNVSCVYRDIIYVDSWQHLLGPPQELRGDQKYLLRNSDHVKVSCHGTRRSSSMSASKIEENINRNVIQQPQFSNVFVEPGFLRSWSGRKTGLRQVALRKRSSRGPRLNVLMLCLDAMSRNGFKRKMPISYTALRKMGALVLNGYNIVEDTSSAALFPILTGNQREIRKSFTKDSIDEDSFIFTRLSKMGYRTAFFEDAPIIATFKGTFGGFEKPPTDHYLLPFLLEKRIDLTSRGFCAGDRPLYELLLNLTYQFYQLSGSRFSFTFISDFGREEFDMRSAADQDLAHFLRRLQQGGALEDTVLFVMGNHGRRLTPFRETRQGKLEERLPLMAVVVPERLQQTRPEDVAAMAANVDVLTTPFDVHTTLTDLFLMEFRRNRYKVPGADVERGKTLLQPAGVAPHWCACAAWRPLAPADPRRKTIGYVVADYINSLTLEWRRECVVRKLVSVEDVLLLTPNSKLLNYKHKLAEHEYFGKIGGMFKPSSKIYQATIVMSPGRAVFETTLKYYLKGDYFVVTQEYISRINSYANESACIKRGNPILSKICYCR